jgi:hypothetical protein
MELFENLSNLVHQRWRHQNFDEAAFPEIATDALTDLNPSALVTPGDIMRWVVSSPVLPPQIDLQGEFGQPPVCLATNSRFFIQALFWMDGTTSIHQHGFSGAFHVLAGSSIHSSYRFQAETRINKDLLLGKVQFQSAELLRAGATRPIPSGDSLIHALFHLDRPSVTVVLRTHNENQAGPQFEYFKPFVARNPFHRDPELTRRMQVLEVLASTNHADYMALAQELAHNGDFATVLQLTNHYRRARPGDAELVELIEVARQRHGDRVDVLLETHQEIARQRYLWDCRKVLTNADHRFLLALLLNLPSRREIIRLVEDRCDTRDAVGLILAWLTQISELAGRGDASASPLGIRLEEGETAILRHLMQGHTPRSIVDLFRSEHDDLAEDEGAVVSLCHAFQGSKVFGPLFAD